MNILLAALTLILSYLFVPEAIAANSENSVKHVQEGVDSWIALGIILSSVLVSLLLNGVSAKIRLLGTLLASTGCFAIVVWFLSMLDTGILTEPKPPTTPMDLIKPMLLWGQIAMAFLVGVGLCFVAYKQSNATDVLVLPMKNEGERYGRVSRVLHWTIAILFLSLIPMGVFTSMIPEDAWFRTEYYVVHKTLGVCVFVLVALRLIWNVISVRPKLDKGLKSWERKLAHTAHLALYFLMLALPITGFVMTSFHGYPTFFFAWELAPLWEQSETGTIVWGVMHKYLLPYLVYVILGAHILGALKHRYIDKHKEALKRMVA